MAGFFFLLSVMAWGQSEPDPETYIPPFVEIREHAPAGVTDEWWMRIAKPLIWHVTPAFTEIPSFTSHEPYEVIRSATAGFLIRNATGWDLWPEPLDSLRDQVEEISNATQVNYIQINSNIINATEIYNTTQVIEYFTTNILNATYITSVTQENYYNNSNILNATYITSVTQENYYNNSNIINATTIFADRIVTEKTTQKFTGDHSMNDVALTYPAYRPSLSIRCIVTPGIYHPIDWVEDYHYYVLLDDRGRITAVRPLTKWAYGCDFWFEYVRAE